MVSEVEVRSCWADAGRVMEGENDGGSEREGGRARERERASE